MSVDVGRQAIASPALRQRPWWGSLSDPTIACGLLITLGALVVYIVTAYRTVAFWDSGEFITTSYILGIPHQPSTPLYVLIGRLATLIPLGPIALRVNMLSAVASALTVFFTYLATVRLAWRMGATTQTVAIIAGLVAGVLTAFSSSIWLSAIEAEVYALSGMMVAISIWAVVRWADQEPHLRDTRTILIIFYLLSLSIAIHLGTYLVLPGLLVLVIRERPPWLLERRDLIIWFVGLPILTWLLTGAAREMDFGLASGATGFLFSYLLLLVVARDRRFAAALILLLGVGVSVHLFLPIRAHLDPMINEGEPDSWQRFWDTLTRAQYPAPNVMVRRAALLFQFDHMFFRYLREQWLLFAGGLGGILPLLAAVWGGWQEARRDRSGFWMMFLIILVTGPAMVLYLNFTDHEVRERDYFFVLCFQTVAMWGGLGAAAVADALARRRGAGAAAASGGAALSRRVVLGAGVILFLLAVQPLVSGWRLHDRSEDWIARDYAYNLLTPLPADAVLFTNGDNDTFPLWYLQAVEGIRQDVRVVNLSLLNTPWYIRQIRDQEPRVPVELTDDQIAFMRPILNPDGSVLLVKDLAVEHILSVTPRERPVYLAVTVPDRMGLDDARRLRMEGLANRIHPEPVPLPIDVEICRRNVYEVFTPLRGILTETGETDRELLKSENETRLMQNYAAIHFYMAVELDRRRQVSEALAEAERAQAISPGFSGNRLFLGILYEKTGDLARAEAHYVESIEVAGEDQRLTHRLGWVVAQQGRLSEAVPILRRSIELGSPGYRDPYLSLFEVYVESGMVKSGLGVLDAWLAAHPDDAEMRRIRQQAASGELFRYQQPDSIRGSTPLGGGDSG